LGLKKCHPRGKPSSPVHTPKIQHSPRNNNLKDFPLRCRPRIQHSTRHTSHSEGLA